MSNWQGHRRQLPVCPEVFNCSSVLSCLLQEQVENEDERQRTPEQSAAIDGRRVKILNGRVDVDFRPLIIVSVAAGMALSAPSLELGCTCTHREGEKFK